MIKNIYRYLIIPVLLLPLSGCDLLEQNDDLQSFIDTVKAKPKRPIEPDPVIPDYVPYPYTASYKRSPFQIPMSVLGQMASDPSIKPENHKCRGGFLESFDLDAFRLIGDLDDVQGKKYALVKINDVNGVFKVRAGECIGTNYGLVNSIGINNEGANKGVFTLKITEIVEDGMGGYLYRPQLFTLDD